MNIDTAKHKINKQKDVFKLGESSSHDRIVFAEKLKDFFLITEILKEGNETHQIRLDKGEVERLKELNKEVIE